MAIVTLAQVKQHLQIDADDTDSDAELADFIAAVPAVIERWVGPVEGGSRTETVAGWPLVVSSPPILAVTAASWAGGVIDPAGLVVDQAAGLIDAGAAVRFYGGAVTVTYTTGYAAVPPAVNLAARVIVAHWWESQRGNGAGGSSVRGGEDYPDVNSVPGMGFALPRYAIELLEPFRVSTGLR